MSAQRDNVVNSATLKCRLFRSFSEEVKKNFGDDDDDKRGIETVDHEADRKQKN